MSTQFDVLNDIEQLFDHVPDRRHSDSTKWNFYDEDVLPLWVADMDFASPKAVIDALHQRVDHGIFGYGQEPPRLRELICARMENIAGWHITPEQIIFLPGLVCGLNVVARASDERGSDIMVNTPVYPPFLSAPVNQERTVTAVPLASSHRTDSRGRTSLYYEMDFGAMQSAIQPNTKLFMLCNPHNPVGRAYTIAEQTQLADFCLRNNLDICSDAIPSDLRLGGNKHHPIAARSPEIANRTITLMAPSKTFNIPGLGCSFAIIPNADLRQRVLRAATGIVPHVNVLGFVAATAAYEHGDAWLTALKSYLTSNRDLIFDFFKSNLPSVELTLPEATYLAWLDFRAYGIEDPYKFFLDNAKVALSSGAGFGDPGKGFVRLNFGCSKITLQQALNQMAMALSKVTAA